MSRQISLFEPSRASVRTVESFRPNHREPRLGKFSHTRGAAGSLGSASRTSQIPGYPRAPSEPCARSAVPTHPEACKRGRGRSFIAKTGPKNQPFFRRSSACSRAVFWSWWYLHRLWWLPASTNSAQSPRNGLMWSTTVAFVRLRKSSAA